MPTFDAMHLLRPGVLDGATILLARGPGAAPLGEALAGACASLGAGVHVCEAQLQDGRYADADDGALGGAPLQAVDLLAVDAGSLIDAVDGAGGALEGQDGLIAAMDAVWSLTQAVADEAFIAPGRPGRIVYLAPPAGTPLAHAAVAALENLARTLSIEWARYRVTTVAVAPGADTTPGRVAAVAAYLASPAGAYFSGCLLDLRGPA